MLVSNDKGSLHIDHGVPYYHVWWKQRMAPEELLADRDSEDELDEDLATLEDRRVIFSALPYVHKLLDSLASGCNYRGMTLLFIAEMLLGRM